VSTRYNVCEQQTLPETSGYDNSLVDNEIT